MEKVDEDAIWFFWYYKDSRFLSPPRWLPSDEKRQQEKHRKKDVLSQAVQTETFLKNPWQTVKCSCLLLRFHKLAEEFQG